VKTWVMIPTYNEAENIKALIKDILNLKKDINIVVVDDDSPDKTWKIVEDISKKEKNVHLLLRKTKKGRGLAGIAGFKYCLDKGADYIIEMDADFSHDPLFIAKLLEKIPHYDLVLGSRYTKGGKDTRKGLLRAVISHSARTYIRLILGIKVKDPTSGYRCFKKHALKSINLETLKAKDPFIVTETLYRCHKKGLKIGETPIIFKERKQGKSKLGGDTLLRYLINVLKLRFS